MLTKNETAAVLFRGAATTARDVLLQVRNRGWRSKYCLKHSCEAGTYHATHITQLLTLEGMCTDPAFAAHADLLAYDFPLPASGRVRFMPGRHTAYRFSSTGAILGSKTVTLSAANWADCSARDKVLNRTGIW